MFTTADMTKIVLAGTLDQLPDTLNLAANLKTIHIKDYEGTELNLGTPDESADDLSKELARMRGCAASLNPKADSEMLSAPVVRRELADTLISKVGEVVNSIKKAEDIEDQIEQNLDFISVLNKLSPLGLELNYLRDYDSLDVNVGIVPNLGNCRLALTEVNNDMQEISSNISGKDGVIAVFSKNNATTNVQKILASEGFQPIQLPKEGGLPSEIISQLEKENGELANKLSTMNEELDSWNLENGGMLLGGMELLERDLEVHTAPVKVAVSEHAFILEGWVISENAEETKKLLLEVTTYVETEDFEMPDHHHGHSEHEVELPPVAFTNSPMAQPYELLTDAVGRPRYGRMDPTSFMFLTYPLFFGIMLGDLAYGLATMGLAWWVNKKFGKNDLARHASKLLYYIGASTAIFGIIFGEVLGFDVTPGSTHAPSWLSWMSIIYPHHHISLHLPLNVVLAYPFHRVGGNLEDLIIITIYMGVAHLALGMIIGFRDVLKEHGLVAAIFEKGSWMLVLGGGFFAVYSFIMSGKQPSDAYAAVLADMGMYGGSVLLTGVVMVIIMLWKYEDIPLPIAIGLGPLECLQILSNTISYVRLFAVGLVGVKIAELGNEKFFEPAAHAMAHIGHDPLTILISILSIILLVVLWIAVQLFALGLGLFSPNVQAARLHFVEWMGKFYEVGGVVFAPFGHKQNYVEVE